MTNRYFLRRACREDAEAISLVDPNEGFQQLPRVPPNAASLREGGRRVKANARRRYGEKARDALRNCGTKFASSAWTRFLLNVIVGPVAVDEEVPEKDHDGADDLCRNIAAEGIRCAHGIKQQVERVLQKQQNAVIDDQADNTHNAKL